jgi:hypothetical protein
MSTKKNAKKGRPVETLELTSNERTEHSKDRREQQLAPLPLFS